MVSVLIAGLILTLRITECKVTLFGGHQCSWLEAYNECRHHNGQLTTNTTGLSDEDKKKLLVSRAWVGKVTLLSKWMKIVGCYYIPDISALMVDVKTVANCEWKCRKYSHFASNSMLNENDKTCICLTTLPNVSSHAKNCETPHSAKHMTVYARYEKAVESKQRDGNCMFNSCTPGIQLGPPTIISCDVTGQARGVCENGKPVQSWNMDWMESLKYCIKNYGVYFIDYFSKNCGKVLGLTWTRYFRQMFTVALQSTDEVDLILKKCGTLIYDLSVEDFQLFECNLTLPYYVCEIDGLGFHSTTRTNRQSTTVFGTAGSGNATNTVTTFTTHSKENFTRESVPLTKKTFAVKPTEHRYTEVSNKTQSDDLYDKHISITGTIIGVAVAIIVIVLGILIAVLIYKKRRCHMKDNTRESQGANEDPHRTYEGLNFGVVQSSGTVDHEYAVLKTKTHGSHELRKDTKAPTYEETFYENQ